MSITYPPRPIGADGPMVNPVALGCMSFGGMYGPTDREESFACLQAALDRGIDHWDTARIYGMGVSEEIIGDFLRQTGAAPTIATKAGIVPAPERRFDNGADYLRETLEGCLERLGRPSVELFYIHRREAERPVEEVMETLLGFREEGLIGGIGFSEVEPDTIRRAAAVGPVAAVQSEYSLWTRLPELGVIQACHEVGAAFVAFSPLARGVLTDADPDVASIGERDIRRSQPRFQEPAWTRNRARVARFRDWCGGRGWAPAAVAVAWTVARYDNVISIPGTRSAAHLHQWADAMEITLDDEAMGEIEAILPVGWAAGDRYSVPQWVGVERYA